MASWNTIKEAVRALKGQMSKNERNAAKYQQKKERGPVKAFFHITKNENVPAIEQQGLLTNHPNANINSANHPFRKHGTDAGGVWVTTEPTAFPVYGTTIGGRNGNASARADALSTIKIEVPLPELAKMKAVQDPYGKNILRKGNDPEAVEKFGTWAGIDVPTTVLLNDIKPQWLKNIGYVEEAEGLSTPVPTLPASFRDIPAGSFMPLGIITRQLNKSDFKAYTGFTGHKHGRGSHDKSPQRFVLDQLSRIQPISKRLPTFPTPDDLYNMSLKQGGVYNPVLVIDGIPKVPDPNAAKRYSLGFIPANKWTAEYQDYVKPGESINKQRTHVFAPGAISRGMGGLNLPPIEDRHFSWNKYKQSLAEGNTPGFATEDASPTVALNWDNIIYINGQYIPELEVVPTPKVSFGTISRGTSSFEQSKARQLNRLRRSNAEMIRDRRSKASEYLSRNLGRQPTAEEIEHWARSDVSDDIKNGDIQKPWSALYMWANKTDWNVVRRLLDELADHGFD